MKDLKHIQSFNEHQENLNISDVMKRISELEREYYNLEDDWLKDIINQLTELSEGYLNQEEFEDDPEASMKSSIDGLIDFTKEILLIDIPDIYKDYKN